MFTHQTKPTQIEAYEIDAVQTVSMPDGEVVVFHTKLGDRISLLGDISAPQVGDYFILHEGGNGLFATKSSFEDAYEPIPAPAVEDVPFVETPAPTAE